MCNIDPTQFGLKLPTAVVGTYKKNILQAVENTMLKILQGWREDHQRDDTMKNFVEKNSNGIV